MAEKRKVVIVKNSETNEITLYSNLKKIRGRTKNVTNSKKDNGIRKLNCSAGSPRARDCTRECRER